MPASVILASVYGSMAAATAALGTFGVAAATFAINFGVSMIVSRAFAPKVDSPEGLKDNGVRQQVPPNSTNGVPIAYGDCYMGGTFVDAVLSTDQKTMYYVMVISNISPNGQFSIDPNKCYWQDQLIGFGASGYDVGSLTDGAGNVNTKIAGNLYIAVYQSTATGVISSLNGAPMPHVFMGGGDIANDLRWPSTGRQMYGLAFAIIKMNYNRDANTTQMMPITFHVSHYLNNEGAAYPGDVWEDYITNPQYGGAINALNVDSASALALNLYSKQTISYIDADGNPAIQQRYKINGVLDPGKTVLENIDKILICCDSWMAYQAATGQWSLVINKADSIAFNFTDDTIVDAIRVSATDISQSINQIEARFPSKLNRDQNDYAILQTPPFLLYPNEPVNKYSVNYELCNDSVQAQYLANRTLEQAREDLIVIISTTYNGIQINAGDIVTITNSAYGWNQKPFRAMKVNEASLPDGSLGASLELSEYNSQVYDDWAINAYKPQANSDIPSMSYFGALTAPVVVGADQTASVPHFNVVCTLPSVGQVTSITLFYTTSNSPSVTDWVVWGQQVATNSQPFTPATTVTFTNINLPANTYYFAFKLANATYMSDLSPLSTAFSWTPNPTTSAVAGTFVAVFTPPVFQVPRTGGITPVFTGIVPQLYGTAAGGAVNFVTAQTDADVGFLNNTWRIGASSTTGNGDIIATNITLAAPFDGGNYAQWAPPTAQSTSPATLQVPVRFKDNLGIVTQGAEATIQFLFLDPGATGSPGADGNQVAGVYLWEWSTVQPANPTGQSTYTWATGVNSVYTGGGSWQLSIPPNPGIPLSRLWAAYKVITASASTTQTIVDWTTGVNVVDYAQNGADGAPGAPGINGADGLQTADAVVFQWAVTIPAGPTGTSSYTWASGTFTPTPVGWSLSPGTSPSPGYTLYSATVRLLDIASVTNTTINWTSAVLAAISYAGTNGTSGTSGSSARLCYTKTTLSSLDTTPLTITTIGNASFPPNDSWGVGTIWQATPPVLVAGESLYQSDGIYDPVADQTIWNVPYLSSLKVGSLSAITANTGTLSVTGTISSANGNFSVDASGNVTIRNATIGARLLIANNYIKVYDNSNVLRVQIGDLTA